MTFVITFSRKTIMTLATGQTGTNLKTSLKFQNNLDCFLEDA